MIIHARNTLKLAFQILIRMALVTIALGMAAQTITMYAILMAILKDLNVRKISMETMVILVRIHVNIIPVVNMSKLADHHNMIRLGIAVNIQGVHIMTSVMDTNAKKM